MKNNFKSYFLGQTKNGLTVSSKPMMNETRKYHKRKNNKHNYSTLHIKLLSNLLPPVENHRVVRKNNQVEHSNNVLDAKKRFIAVQIVRRNM
jgi:hypothetical protein